MADKELLRRPIRVRDTRWATATARWLGRVGLRPNHISLLSVCCAQLAAACLWLSSGDKDMTPILLLVAAALFIQLRLLCNLFDGMVAVEGGFKTKSGEIYNELPDRFSDAFIFVGAGYSVPGSDWLPTAGWAVAVLAVMTAYVRALGAAAGASQQFCGPMAKQQRMAVMTAACLIAALAKGMHWRFETMEYALPLVIIGCLLTLRRRALRVIKELESK